MCISFGPETVDDMFIIKRTKCLRPLKLAYRVMLPMIDGSFKLTKEASRCKTVSVKDTFHKETMDISLHKDFLVAAI
jgi:hypothetical protein